MCGRLSSKSQSEVEGAAAAWLKWRRQHSRCWPPPALPGSWSCRSQLRSEAGTPQEEVLGGGYTLIRHRPGCGRWRNGERRNGLGSNAYHTLVFTHTPAKFATMMIHG